eukprot:5807163-Pyramimonas_sp.AAC.1
MATEDQGPISFTITAKSSVRKSSITRRGGYEGHQFLYQRRDAHFRDPDFGEYHLEDMAS